MAYLLIFISICFLTFVEVIFVVSLKNPALVTKCLHLSKKSQVPQWIFGISALIFSFILYLFLIDLKSTQRKNEFSTVSQVTSGTPVKFSFNVPEVQLKEHEDFSTGENFYFLYTDKDLSKKKLEVVTQQIKVAICKKPCTINLYDDLHAYTIDRKRASVRSNAVMQDWNKENYVFVAEHYLGYLNSAAYSFFSYYPYKDLFYQKRLAEINKSR